MAKANTQTRQPPGQLISVSDKSLRDLVGYNVKRASNVIQNDLALVLKPFELRMITFTALVLIVDNPGVRQSQLADSLSIERPNFVIVIDELERRELIVRERVPADRRAFAFKVTLKGRRLRDRAMRAVQAHEMDLLQALNKKKRSEITEAMRMIESSSGQRSGK